MLQLLFVLHLCHRLLVLSLKLILSDRPGMGRVEAGLAGLAQDIVADWNERVLRGLDSASSLQTLEDLRSAGASFGAQVRKVFVADGDALILDLEHWRPILESCRRSFPRLEYEYIFYAIWDKTFFPRPL